METTNNSTPIPEWAPENIVLDKPNPARIYDYLLGGFHNFEADRMMAERVLVNYPGIKLASVVNRAFLRRAVMLMRERGINQFLDLGSGLPTYGNVHQVAQTDDPNVRVVYVDIDPVAVEHSKLLLTDNPNATAIIADIRQPKLILDNEKVKDLLDFNRPMGLVVVGMLHYVKDDEEAYNAVSKFAGAVVPGSYLAISHPTTDVGDTPTGKTAYKGAGISKSRSGSDILRFFSGFNLVDPGLVYTPLWRPESPEDLYVDEPEKSFSRAGVGRKL